MEYECRGIIFCGLAQQVSWRCCGLARGISLYWIFGPPLVPNQPLTKRVPMAVTSAVRRTRREAGHLSSLSAKVKNARTSTSTPYILWKMWSCTSADNMPPRARGGVEVWLYWFLTTDGRSTSRSGLFEAGKVPQHRLYRRLAGPSAGLDGCAVEKISHWCSNHEPSIQRESQFALRYY